MAGGWDSCPWPWLSCESSFKWEKSDFLPLKKSEQQTPWDCKVRTSLSGQGASDDTGAGNIFLNAQEWGAECFRGQRHFDININTMIFFLSSFCNNHKGRVRICGVGTDYILARDGQSGRKQLRHLSGWSCCSVVSPREGAPHARC